MKMSLNIYCNVEKSGKFSQVIMTLNIKTTALTLV